MKFCDKILQQQHSQPNGSWCKLKCVCSINVGEQIVQFRGIRKKKNKNSASKNKLNEFHIAGIWVIFSVSSNSSRRVFRQRDKSMQETREIVVGQVVVQSETIPKFAQSALSKSERIRNDSLVGHRANVNLKTVNKSGFHMRRKCSSKSSKSPSTLGRNNSRQQKEVKKRQTDEADASDAQNPARRRKELTEEQNATQESKQPHRSGASVDRRPKKKKQLHSVQNAKAPSVKRSSKHKDRGRSSRNKKVKKRSTERRPEIVSDDQAVAEDVEHYAGEEDGRQQGDSLNHDEEDTSEDDEEISQLHAKNTTAFSARFQLQLQAKGIRRCICFFSFKAHLNTPSIYRCSLILCPVFAVTTCHHARHQSTHECSSTWLQGSRGEHESGRQLKKDDYKQTGVEFFRQERLHHAFRVARFWSGKATPIFDRPCRQRHDRIMNRVVHVEEHHPPHSCKTEYSSNHDTTGVTIWRAHCFGILCQWYKLVTW